jgi:hypothetical protein
MVVPGILIAIFVIVFGKPVWRAVTLGLITFFALQSRTNFFFTVKSAEIPASTIIFPTLRIPLAIVGVLLLLLILALSQWKYKKIIYAAVTFGSLVSYVALTLLGPKIPYLNLSIPLYQLLSCGVFIFFASELFPFTKPYLSTFLLGVAFLAWRSGIHFSFFWLWLTCLTFPQIPMSQLKTRFAQTKNWWKQIGEKKFQKIKAVSIGIVQRYPNFTVWVFLFALTLVFYHLTFRLFFQGDEWIFFETYLGAVRSSWWPVAGLFRVFAEPQALGFHMSPLLELIYVWTFHLFGLNYLAYLLLYLFIHSINGILMFIFVKELTGKKSLALTAATFFIISVNQSQAFTWISAAPGTTIALSWMMLSLIFLFRYFRTSITKNWYLCCTFLFLGLMTKETTLGLVLVVPIFYFWLRRPSVQEITKKMWPLVASVAIFGGMRVLFAPHTNPGTSSAPALSISEKITNLHLDLAIFRYFSFAWKGFAQMFIPNEILMKLSIWITQMQFPYFNAEKSIWGTTYLSFIQGPGIEFISYILALILILALVLLKIPKKIVGIATIIYLAGILPLVGLTYVFPFWGYTPTIDSRHFYHMAVAAALLFTFAAYQLIRVLLTTFPRLKIFSEEILLAGVVFLWAIWQYNYAQQTLRTYLPDAIQRKIVLQTMKKTIGTPPKKMIIFTTSNKSYYGMAEYMLPFQTQFSHVIPVMFEKSYNSQGRKYPESFFGPKFNLPGGIVSQGYREDGEFGIGYYLDKIRLIKALEKNHLSPDMLFAFNYNGDSYTLTDITGQTRQEMKEILSSREQFSSWKRVGSQPDRVFFQVEPTWNVTKNEKTYLVTDEQKKPILAIEIMPNNKAQTHSQFVSEQEFSGQKVQQNFTTQIFSSDLDLPHVAYSPKDHPEILYTVAGNNFMFHKITIFDAPKAQKIFRTLEFVDDLYDENNL